MRIPFVLRQDRLEPIAVVGLGAVARNLARRLLELDDAALHELRGTGGQKLLVVLGAPEVLPWVDGVTYLGRDPGATRLLIPTMMRPAIAVDAFERAIAHHVAPLPSPWAVLPDARLLFSTAQSGAIDRELLGRWLEAQS